MIENGLKHKRYRVIIVGAGVSGDAAAFVLSSGATDLSGGRIAVIEQYSDAALVSSNTESNAQTRHKGISETNYGCDAALVAKDAADLIDAFLAQFGIEGTYVNLHIMVIGVGDEVETIEERFRILGPHYPHSKLLSRDDIARIEPMVIEGRDPDEKINAIGSDDGKAIDYHEFAKTMLNVAVNTGKTDVFFNTAVQEVTRADGYYIIDTGQGRFEADYVIFDAGPYSLTYAHKLGYGLNLAIIPVDGGFYRVEGKKDGRPWIVGKVYTVQDPILKWAAPHADRSVKDPMITRFGPTANPVPLFEKHHWKTFIHFLNIGTLNWKGIKTLFKISSNPIISKFLLKNRLYKLPVLGKYLYLRWAARKIIPTLQYGDLQYARGEGGIRPQLIDTDKGIIKQGAAKIIGDGIIFNTAPNIGASSCLQNAVRDAKILSEIPGSTVKFDEKKLREEILGMKI